MVKNWSISCVLRVPADGGDLYFKTVPPLFVQEARITATVAGLFPTNVPGVVGIEETRGWTLLEDFGTRRLRTEPLAQWGKAVRILARMHLAYLDRASALLAAGFPDRRPRRLAEQIAPLLADPITSAALAGRTLARLRKQVGRLRDLCAQLEGSDPPATLIHGDFHPGNVAIHDGKPIFFDWTDGCLAHPFFDLVTLMPDAARDLKGEPDAPGRLRDAYLSVWADCGGEFGALAETFEVAQTLGTLHQAVSYWGLLRATAGQPQEDWSAWLGHLLRHVLRPLR
jgi:aminoglycoside phosphotransferase (APT) family kinase protein